MAPEISHIFQNVVHLDSTEPLRVVQMKLSDLNKDHSELRTVVERNEGRALGLSAAYLPTGTLKLLAIADATTIIAIKFNGSGSGNKDNGRGNSPTGDEGRDYLRDHVLRRSCGFLYAFDIAPLALALWQDHDLRIQQAIDMQSAGPPTSRAPLKTIKFAVCDLFEVSQYSDNINCAFGDYIYDSDTGNVTALAQRAWVTHYLSQLSSMEERLSQVPPVDTTKLSDPILEFLAGSSQNAFQLYHMNPLEVTHTLTTTFDPKQKKVHAKAQRYQNQIRKNFNQDACIHVGANSITGAYTVSATVGQSSGNTTHLQTAGHLTGRQITAITISGREDPTAAASKRAQVVLEILQGKVDGINPWCQYILLDVGKDFAWPAEWAEETRPIKFKPKTIPRSLNSSQIKAIQAMLQVDKSRATIIQGPPGTGKTTVIASFVQTVVAAGKSGIWLIAQSNIAVKNIAEKLANFNLTNWKLLISNQFYEVWHEHLYAAIKANLIISEDFSEPHLLFKQLSGCPVILSTLSMLSSFQLHKLGVFRQFPLNTVVIDEASQIEIGDYIPLFNIFTTIRKVVFIGDDKQLPPHGQQDVSKLKSIFEVEHLKDQITFLDTQYRMPPQIGDFISQAVYDSKLQSNPGHPLADTDQVVCHFVNVTGQQMSQGTSFKNLEECKAIVQLAAIFEAENKKFKIITPYDAQRSCLENALKESELAWGDTCFNVDSFQGNEEDYIIISLVRSSGLGFLQDLRRTNVMLTRCKKGMVIFTSKKFMEKDGVNCLVGSLLHDYYDNEVWIEVDDLKTTVF